MQASNDNFNPQSFPEKRKYKAQLACILFALLVFFLWLSISFEKKTEIKEAAVLTERIVHATMLISIITLAECFYRIFLLIEEIWHLKTRHKNSYKLMICFVFNGNKKIYLVMVVNMLVSVTLLMNNSTLYWSVFMENFDSYCALLIIMSVVFQFKKPNQVELSQIMEDNKLSIGRRLAFCYYSSYLKIVLNPDFGLTFRERIVQYEQQYGTSILVKKLFILVTESGFIHRNLEHYGDENIKRAHQLPDLERDRAGTQNRTYKNTVYEISVNKDKPLRCVVEGATPLLSMREMSHAANSGLTEDKLKEEILQFYHELNNLLEADVACSNSYELILYKDSSDGHNEPLSHVVKNSIEESLAKEYRSI
ncbi:stimulator of interferon genes protein-like isoform X1 [Tachypleus tridentatus]|uniref:stimulator of interferon genes protein-like isoform X1 n=1 Tax=Tachypleus tridentatus TaxID=6853 RepID=UPI003FD60AA4